MTNKLISRKLSRRDLFKLGGQAALAVGLAGGVFSTLARLNPLQAAPLRPGRPPLLMAPPARPSVAATYRHLAATDGFISLPGRRLSDDNGVYVFGFAEAPLPSPGNISTTVNAKGQVTLPAPIFGFNEDDDVYITLTNVGLVVRPDLDDSHTIHWHGFRNPNSIFDGVPEVSIAVPVARDFAFYYKPRDPGTYMYHCHFEDVEHVQMGMDGIVFVRPAGHAKWAYNDASTEFDREFTLLLNEVWTKAHDNLASIQENIWTDYKPDYWVINGRSYPDTILRDQELPGSDFDRGPTLDPTLRYSQPVSSLIQVNSGDRVLLRFANLGYEQNAMQLPGLRMKVVGEDAVFLGQNSYETNTIYMGPGEARDVLFTAPAFVGPGEPSDGVGPHNIYWLKNHNYHYLTNGGATGLGGQVTQVRVYPAGTLPAQTGPNKTF
ncbi:MAG: multicopper oxidase domain-containing protein [Anaerolineae bacterium]